MNELILADKELEVGFIGKLDALLEGIERVGASCKALPNCYFYFSNNSLKVYSQSIKSN